MSEQIKKLAEWFQKLSKGKKIGICAGCILLCVSLVGGIFLVAKLSRIHTDDIDEDSLIVNENLAPTEGYTNVALFGIDSRSGELEKGTRTDCLIVASLNNETKEIRMVSVYRDTVLDIEDNYLQKCNAAYAFGGPTQAINMLNKNLDLNIQDYATVDFAAIADAIDLLGGLEIDIKEEEIKPLNKFVKETARVAGKKANTVSVPGLQHLDGVQATTYARIRSTAGGDFTRTERQRLVIEKIVEKAQQSDLGTINQIIDELFPSIKTSFSVAEILSYAKDFMKYKIAESGGFPFEKTTATISGLGSIVIPVTLEDNVSELHRFLYDTQDYQPSETVVNISSAIVARVGQREATDYDTLSSKTYVDTEEDKAQEHNQYQPPQNTTTDKEEEKDPESTGGADDNKPPKEEKPSEEKPSGGQTTEKEEDTSQDDGNDEVELPEADEEPEVEEEPVPDTGSDSGESEGGQQETGGESIDESGGQSEIEAEGATVENAEE